MEHLLEKYRSKKPEIVFEWSDPETEAQGWVVINSLRNGAAGGGTRMRLGLDKNEVESLAKVMEIKFTVSGPDIGGAKSGINFDPRDPRRDGVLQRWFKAVVPLLKNYYGTGGDLNVDELHDVIPITEDLGLWHPQEGVVNGHFEPGKSEKIHLIGQLRQGVSKKLEDIHFTPDLSRKFTVADMITGYGVAESVKHYYRIFKDSDIANKRVIVQGFGNVAGAAALYLSQSGAKIVGIIDKMGGLIREEGFSFEEIKTLFLQRKSNQLAHPQLIPFAEVNEKIWDIPTEIFIPGAASRIVSQAQVERLLAQGLECISCGANVPFIDNDIFFGDTAKYIDNHCSLIPDFIANCGMARVFAYLMSEKDVEISDAAIFGDTSQIIFNALENVHHQNQSDRQIAQTAMNMALLKLLHQNEAINS
ncbi:MAG: Glu/Leu/Phe/Val dehydrogenase dimerization domain-containing protein [Chitinophagales bacterium]|nr:amino acid dehydrogenase [Bacteroidota bacterium]MCB9043285.1 amino acid dehydrogenase [Chitinophagales bacterium]